MGRRGIQESGPCQKAYTGRQYIYKPWEGEGYKKVDPARHLTQVGSIFINHGKARDTRKWTLPDDLHR